MMLMDDEDTGSLTSANCSPRCPSPPAGAAGRYHHHSARGARRSAAQSR
jgi:hypothetical protein